MKRRLDSWDSGFQGFLCLPSGWLRVLRLLLLAVFPMKVAPPPTPLGFRVWCSFFGLFFLAAPVRSTLTRRFVSRDRVTAEPHPCDPRWSPSRGDTSLRQATCCSRASTPRGLSLWRCKVGRTRSSRNLERSPRFLACQTRVSRRGKTSVGSSASIRIRPRPPTTACTIRNTATSHSRAFNHTWWHALPQCFPRLSCPRVSWAFSLPARLSTFVTVSPRLVEDAPPPPTSVSSPPKDRFQNEKPRRPRTF